MRQPDSRYFPHFIIFSHLKHRQTDIRYTLWGQVDIDRRVRMVLPPEPRRMPVKAALLHMTQIARSDPVPVMLGKKHLTLGIETKTGRLLETGCKRFERSVFSNGTCPAAPENMTCCARLAPEWGVENQRDPEASVGKQLGRETECMMIAGLRPGGHRFIRVSHSVTVQVPDPRELTPLSQIESSIFILQPYRLMKPVSKPCITRHLTIIHVGVLQNPDLAPTGSDRYTAVRQSHQTRSFHGNIFRRRNSFQPIILVHISLILCGDQIRQHDRQHDRQQNTRHKNKTEH